MTSDRQLKILHHLAVKNEVKVQELSALLGVSPSTIRRELTELEASGLLVRVHGAAKLQMPIRYEPPYEKRAAQHLAEKRAIARAAQQMITPGMVIGIMGGTTCTELARLLRAMEHITIVTNALNVSLELHSQLNKRIMVTGGMLNYNSYELIGNQAIESLKHVHLSIAFIGVSGVSVAYGFSMSDEPESSVGRAFIDAADRTVVLADHSKIGPTTFARLCPLSDLDLLITDSGIHPEQLSEIERAGQRVLIAPDSF